VRDAPGDPEPYRGTHVAVVGATGFIGRWVVRALARRGARLALVVRDEPAARALLADEGPSGEVWRVDGCDRRSVTAALDAARPAVVFNLAGYGSDPAERDQDRTRAQQLNADLVATVCDWSGRPRPADWPGCEVVHVGSVLERAALEPRASANPGTTALYSESKRAGTRIAVEAARASGLRIAVVRLCQVYGWGEAPGRLVPMLLAARRTTDPIRLSAGTQARDFTYVEDVADGLLRVGQTDVAPGTIVELGTGRMTTVRGFVETAAEVFGLAPGRLTFGAIETAHAFSHPAVSTAELEHLTGWIARTSPREGLRRVLAYESDGDAAGADPA